MSKNKAYSKIKKAPQSAISLNLYLISIIVVVSFAIVVFTAWFIVGTDTDLNKVTVPHDVQEQIANLDPAKKTPLGSFQINMNTEWTFPSGKSTSKNAFVSNYIGNTHTVYFTISPANSKEIIYTSPYIPIGGTLNNITLNCDLPAGTHKARLTYHLIDANGTDHSTLAMNIKINILE